MSRGTRHSDRRSWERYESPEYDRQPSKRRAYDERPIDNYAQETFSSLRLSDINPRVPDQQVREAVYTEMKRFGEFNVKFAHTVDRRLVYVNFVYPEDAYAAKQALVNRLFMFDRPVCVESVYHKQSFYRQGNGKDQSFYHGGSPYVPGPRHFPEPPADSYLPRNDGYDDYHNSNRKEPKFPFHLNHIPPEEDEKATRTLFVGNVDHDLTTEALRKYFEPYGIVEDVNIKYPPQGGGNPYAFVRFFHLDMAHEAKVKLSGQMIGRFPCKIGYGKPAPTCFVWVGGIESWIGKHTILKEFDRFGHVIRLEWPLGHNYVYVEYDSVESAKAAVHEMRGFMFRGTRRGIRIDFAEPKQVEGLQPDLMKSSHRNEGRGDERYARRRRSRSFSRNYSSDDEGDRRSRRSRLDSTDRRKHVKEIKRTRKPRVRSGDSENDSLHLGRKKKRTSSLTDSDSIGNGSGSEGSLRKKDKVFQIGNIEAAETVLDLARCLPVVWSGCLVLKNSVFSTRMHLVHGDVRLVDTLMRDPTSTERPSLKITQRLRMDRPKLEEVERRILLSGDDGWCVLLVMPGSSDYEDLNGSAQQRPLKNLVSYLRQKDAAGVLSLPPSSKHGCEMGLLHTFPPCEFAHQYLLKHAPRLVADFASEDHIIVFLVRVNV